MNRRSFLAAAACAGASLTLPLAAQAAEDPPAPKKKIKLGLDNFAVRAMNWKAPALLDYAASLKLDSILISDLDAFENHEVAYLREIKAKADSLGVGIHVGSMSLKRQLSSRTFGKEGRPGTPRSKGCSRP